MKSEYGLTREIIFSRKGYNWSIDKIIRTPIRKLKPRKKDYKGFKSREDYDALHECNPKQRITLGL